LANRLTWEELGIAEKRRLYRAPVYGLPEAATVFDFADDFEKFPEQYISSD
jgi:hypothetical protein